MINRFDEVEETVKLYEAKLKGKLQEDLNFDHLNMKIIMTKNRKIQANNKTHKIKVIDARKLRIKISEVFNRNIKMQRSNYVNSKVFLSAKSERRLESLSKVKQRQSILKTDGNRLKRLQSLDIRIGKKKEFQKININKNNQIGQSGGMINLFDRFSASELSEIESNEQYFLVKSDLIDLFRKYMHKKRANCKDQSYVKFMLRNDSLDPFLPLDGSTLNTESMKGYILRKLGISDKKSVNSGHLLTNPLSTEYSMKKLETNFQNRDQSHQYSIPHFSDFKIRQQQNIEKLRIMLDKRRRKLRNDIVYNAGIVAENRAVFVDKRNMDISRRNSLQNQRSNLYRSRLNTQHQTYGRSVELTEQLRAEFLRKRQKKQRSSKQ